MKKLLIPLIFCLGCNTEKRFNDYSIKHPDKFNQLAAVLAPCVDLNPKSDTIYRNTTDTLITPGNTVIERRNDTVFVTKQLPGKTIIKKEVQTVTKTVADSRAIEACEIKTHTAENTLTISQTQLEQSKKAKNTWMWIAIGCMIAIVAFSVIRVYKFFSGGAITGLFK